VVQHLFLQPSPLLLQHLHLCRVNMNVGLFHLTERDDFVSSCKLILALQFGPKTRFDQLLISEVDWPYVKLLKYDQAMFTKAIASSIKGLWANSRGVSGKMKSV
jgi:hypothetical protein